MIMRRLEAHFFAPLHETALEVKNALSGSQARPEFVGIERLDPVIVGAGFEPGDNILFVFAQVNRTL